MPTTSFANAPSDKLRVLGETLLDILLYTVYEIGPVANVSAPDKSGDFFLSLGLRVTRVSIVKCQAVKVSSFKPRCNVHVQCRRVKY